MINNATGLIVMAKALLAVKLAASVTTAVKLYVPIAVGIPDKRPLDGSVRPGGSEPVVDHRYGDVPPLTSRVAE